MRRKACETGRQRALLLDRETEHQPAEEIREALIQALAELLVQACGEDTGEASKTQGGRDESEDHR